MITNGTERLVRALKDGWGFQYLEVNPFKFQRHSMYVTKKGAEGWWAVKVNADIREEDCLNALLDEAGVPK